MKKRSILAGILVLALLVTVFPALPIFAEGTLSDRDIIPDVKVTQSLNFTTGFQTNDSMMVQNCAFTDNGLEIKSKSSAEDDWGIFQWNNGDANWAPLGGDTKAVRLRAKMTDSSSTMWIRAGFSSNQCVYIDVTARGVSVRHGNSQFTSSGDIGTFVPGTDWVTYLIVPHTDAYSIYAKKDGETKWTCAIEKVAYWSGKRNWYFGTPSTSPYYVSSLEVLESLQKEFSTEEILGTQYATKNYLKFDAEFDWEKNGAKRENVDSSVSSLVPPPFVIGDHGLEIVDTGLNRPSVAEDPLLPLTYMRSGTGKAVVLTPNNPIMFRAKLNQGYLNFQANTAANSKRAFINITTSNIILWGNVSGSNAGYSTGFAPGNDWMTYLVTTDGTNYSLYARRDGVMDDAWKLVGTSQGFRNGGSYGVTVENGNQTSPTYLDYIKVLALDKGVSEAHTMAWATKADRMIYGDEFTTPAALAAADVTTQRASVSDGKLILTTVEGDNPSTSFYETDGMGQYEIPDLDIPLGGYLELRFRSNNASKLFVFNDSRELQITLYKQGGNYTANGGAWKELTQGNETNVWQKIRIVRNVYGTYYVYRQVEGEDRWYCLLEDELGRTRSGKPSIRIQQSYVYNTGVNGIAEVDYLRIFGPDTTGNDLLLWDGFKTEVDRTEEACLQSPAAIHAVVKKDDTKDRKLIYAAYDNKGTLVDMEIKSVTRGEEGAFVFDATAHKKIYYVKVFLWEDFAEMNPLLGEERLAIKELPNWCDDWLLEGSSYSVRNVVTLESDEDGEEASITKMGMVEDSFDVTWTMKVVSYSGAENFQIFTGKHRAMLYPTMDGISYRPSDYGTTKKMAKAPYDIGYEEHTYRLVGEGGIADLYIDNQFVQEITLEPNHGSPRIHAWNMGREGLTSTVEISDVKVYEKKKDSDLSSGDTSDPSTSGLKAVAFRDDFEDGDACGWRVKQWSSEDGYLSVSNNTLSDMWTRKYISPGEDFVLKARMRFNSYGNVFGIQAFVPGRALYLSLKEKYCHIRTTYGTHGSEELSLGNDWHEITIETYNKSRNAIVYIDGSPVLDSETVPSQRTDYQLFIYATGAHADCAAMDMDWISFTPALYGVSMTSPARNHVYDLGEGIPLAATVKDPSSVPSIDYQINGKTVATGTAPDYKATLTGLPVGAYEITAVCDGKSSVKMPFAVVSVAEAEIETQYAEGTLTASLSGYQNIPTLQKVVYRLDGKEVGVATTAPYHLSLNGITAEGHVLVADCLNGNDMPICELSAEIKPTYQVGTPSLHYSNELRYSVSGESGSAEVIMANGNHKLHLIHTRDEVQYMDDGQMLGEGATSMGAGSGDFCIITEGSAADIYRNGQLLFSYNMPQSEETAYEVKELGMEVSGASLSIPEFRKQYFVARNVSETSELYPISDALSYTYHLDFVADRDDEAHFVVQDGYYFMDMTLRDGAIYAQTGEKAGSATVETRLADLLPGETYYRVEMAGGMARLYGNGKWLTSFRGGNAINVRNLSVSVTDGEISYISLGDNSDLYLYEDSFESDAEFASEDYWQTHDMKVSVNKKTETMTLDGSGSSTAIAELNAFCGNADLSADVTIQPGARGFWFILNHCITDGYSRVGYNFQTGMYELVDNEKGSFTTQSSIGFLNHGQTVHLDMKIRETEEGKRVLLYADGTLVLDKISQFDHRGNVGFIINKGTAILDNVVYRGDTKPLPGVTDTPISDGPITLDMIENGDEVIMVGGSSGGYKTSDGGHNWERVGGTNMMSYNLAQLPNGELLSFVHKNTGKDAEGRDVYNYLCGVSSDNGQTWREIGYVMEDSLPGRLSMNNRLTVGASGRVYFVSSETNNEDYGAFAIWYSDDNGRSWTQSETYMDGVVEGYCIQEGVVVETATTTRCYFRNDMGMLRYYSSYDRGVTWDMTPRVTPFISSMTCFNLELDPEDGSLYIAWGYDNINLDGTPQFPRTRWGVAKSTDGGETWDWLGTAHENNHINFNMMNLSINVSKDYLILQCFSDDEFDTGTWYSRMVMIDKDKQKTTKRFEQLHTMNRYQIEQTRTISQQRLDRTLVVNSDNGNVVLRGKTMLHCAYDGYLDLQCAAAYLGATVEQGSGGSAILRIGQSAVTVDAADLAVQNGKQYMKLSTLVSQFGLQSVSQGEVQIISPHATWSVIQKKAFALATGAI